MSEIANPLLSDWTAPFGLPPFDEIEPSHFAAAFARAMAAHLEEIEAIAACAADPDFSNTIVALERSGQLLERVSSVFFNLCAADTSDPLQAIEREISPQLARHHAMVALNQALFERLDKLMERRGALGLSPEQNRVLERYHTRFVRSGARLQGDDRKRMSELLQRLSQLGTSFSQNVLADEAAFELVLESEEDLAGLPNFLRAVAAQNAKDRGKAGGHVITLGRSTIEPFLQFSKRRDLRERAYEAWRSRGAKDGSNDNRPIIGETIALRKECARLLGFANYAAFKLDDQMAKTPEAVRELLLRIWQPARRRAGAEARALEAAAQEDGSNAPLAPWDWWFYAERVRKQEHDLDEAEIKPYLQLEQMILAAFHTAQRLFGLTFTRLFDLPLYHKDVRAYEVKDQDNRHLGLFLADYFARPSKRSGAWMSGFRAQNKLQGDVRPIVINVANFAKAPDGEPTLLTFDDARTLFHEFGHALHGLMSDVTYPSISGTRVARDFVELPSQLFEHWLAEPEVLKRFAVHATTGAPMPNDLLERLIAARNFNQGFATVEYTASALVDLDIHENPPDDLLDPVAFEQGVLDAIGMPAAIRPRHGISHFAHIFAGHGYSAGYYSYLWSEVMDADVFQAFKEQQDVFHPATAKRLAAHIYTAGGKQDPAAAYVAFRGRMPTSDALLVKRGLNLMPPAPG